MAAEYKRCDYLGVAKDGHTMLIDDIVKDLQRKSFLEKEVSKLKASLFINLRMVFREIEGSRSRSLSLDNKADREKLKSNLLDALEKVNG